MKVELPPQVFVGSKPEPGKLQPIQNRPDFHWKPTGGLWTSSLREETSDWIDWCRGENFRTHKLRSAWVLRPAVAWLLVLSTPEELEEATRAYGIGRSGLVPDSLLSMGRDLLDGRLDWEALSRDFDGVWIPTLWFRWNFRSRPTRLPARRTGSACASG